MSSRMSEELLPAVIPILVYWVVAAIYQLTLCRMERNRLFTKEEEEAQNLATRRQVIVGVLAIHAMQMSIVVLAYKTGGMAPDGAAAQSPWLLRNVGQMAVALLVMDCIHYMWHRLEHENKFLYKHVHSRHHQLSVPYAYGSQYVHPVESLVTEVGSGLVAIFVSGMSPRTAAVFFSILTVKGLDDHCGMWFPNHPIHRWMSNNAAFHALHHQHIGIKKNYSTHFLIIWDLLLGTYLPVSIEPRKEGGYQLKIAGD